MDNSKNEDLTLSDLKKQLDELTAWKDGLVHTFDSWMKQIDDINWNFKIDDIADWEKVSFPGSPPSEYSFKIIENMGGEFAAKHEPDDHIVIYAYIFYPKNLDKSKKYPLMVLIHGGIHGHFGSSSADIIRDLIKQGYIVVAPDYRGSIGYGAVYYHLIDYGGLEIDDSHASRDWMLENCPYIDPTRIGIMGYSHGGFHTLHNIFRYPKDYTAAYAGVPVSDLFSRLSFRWRGSPETMGRNYGGKSPREDIEAYRWRSPAWNADKLEIPLLIHTNTNDRDVPVIEVESLIAHLKAAGKDFEYKIYQNIPGGHGFERLNTPIAHEARTKAYRFLAKYLKPDNPP